MRTKPAHQKVRKLPWEHQASPCQEAIPSPAQRRARQRLYSIWHAPRSPPHSASPCGLQCPRHPSPLQSAPRSTPPAAHPCTPVRLPGMGRRAESESAMRAAQARAGREAMGSGRVPEVWRVGGGWRKDEEAVRAGPSCEPTSSCLCSCRCTAIQIYPRECSKAPTIFPRVTLFFFCSSVHGVTNHFNNRF
jgi:hypothetical protein